MITAHGKYQTFKVKKIHDSRHLKHVHHRTQKLKKPMRKSLTTPVSKVSFDNRGKKHLQG